MYNITIIGFGVLGKSIGYTLCNNNVSYKHYDILDKSCGDLNDIIKENNKNVDSYYFLCLPTDAMSDGNLDISSIHESCKTLNELCSNRSHVILKSTVLPGTTDSLRKLYTNLHLVFSPEFLREVSSNDDMYNSKFILLGCDPEEDERNNVEIFEFFRFIFSHQPDLLIIYKPNTTLEIFKYTVNVFLATKVLFMNEIYLLTEKMNVSYNELKCLFELDSRLGHSHFNVPNNEKFGFDGTCFPPNTISLKYFQESLGLSSDLLNSVIKRNLEIKKLKND
jgi:nucleotide sugar dehydrogenase